MIEKIKNIGKWNSKIKFVIILMIILNLTCFTIKSNPKEISKDNMKDGENVESNEIQTIDSPLLVSLSDISPEIIEMPPALIDDSAKIEG